MVTGENDLTQIVPMEGVCVADEEKVLCIIRDLVSTTNPGCKHTLNLPASLVVSEVVKEITKICNYDPNTVQIHYEVSHGGGEDDVVLNNVQGRVLGAIVVPSIRKHSFTVHEKDGVTPKKMDVASETSISGYESQASSSTSYTSGDTYNSYTSASHTDPSYSYASALIKSDTGYVGLVNQAMTCYLNSLLQTLYMTPEFRNAIYRWEFEGREGREENAVKSIPYQLQNLFLQLQTSKKKSVETTDLTRSFGWDSSEVWQQHDVQELCRVMFDALENTWKKTDQANLINHLYQGKLKDYVKCLECSNESARTDAYLDIPLVIRPFGSTQAYGSVEQALDAFVQPEILDGSNQYYCERCGKKCNAHKGLKFVTFPYLLTMQLKRFDFDYATMHRIKLNDRMTFPEVLNLNRFVSHNEAGSSCKEEVARETSEVTKTDEVTTNGPTDSSDEGIDEGIEVENGLSGASSSSDTSSLSSEAATNDKNARESVCQGPYEYELFSIMIHSGSAAGGHYYAYIKSFKDGQWYSFNDQQVTKITYDDIRKTYGGSSMARGFYSSAYASSTNAYMLMYRQIDKCRNVECMMPEDFPEHLKLALQKQQEQEEAERKQREIDKSTCKIKLYCFHPSNKKKMESKFEVHKDKTLKEATEMAYRSFYIEDAITLSDCRLVKYDEYSDSLEKSFEGDEESTMGLLLGGVKSSYNFDLLLETKRPDQKFQEYKPGGVTVKVFVVDTKNEEIHPPVNVRAYHVQTVNEFKNLVAQTLELESNEMKCVLERFHNDLRPLSVPNKTLKAEGFFKSNKVYVEYPLDEDSMYTPFLQTKFYELLDRHQNTIRIHVNIPTQVEVEDYLKSVQQINLRRKQLCLSSDSNKVCNDTSDSPDIDEGISDPVDGIDHKIRAMAIHGCHSDPSVYHSCQDNSDCSPQESGSEGRSSSPVGPSSSSQDTSTSAEFSLTTNFTNNDGQSTSPDDLHQFSDKGSGAVEHSFSDPEQVSPPCQVSPNGDSGDKDSDFKQGENWDLEIGDTADSVCSSISSSVSGGKDGVEEEAEPQRYFCAMPCDITQETNQRGLTVYVDKRITLGSFKKELEQYVGTVMENFKVYRVYSNNQEFESIRLTDTLSFLEDGKLNIKLGRALRPGEHRVKVYQLTVNDPEPCKFLVETILAKGMTVLESKKLILMEIKEHCGGMDIPLDRCRLRKKTWKNPGTVYIDSQVYEDEIAIFPNWEVFLEVLDGPELMTSMSQLALYIRRWRPASYEIDPFQEIVLNQQTVEELKLRIAEKSGIQMDNVDFAKGKGTFPCETSVLEIQQDLDWNPQVSTLNVWPLYICDDGHVIFYRDKSEELMELSDEKKKEIQQKENIRISRSSQRLTYSPRKEKALKIYTGEEMPPSSKSSPDLD